MVEQLVERLGGDYFFIYAAIAYAVLMVGLMFFYHWRNTR